MSELSFRYPVLLAALVLPAAVLAAELLLGTRRRARVPLPTCDRLPAGHGEPVAPLVIARLLRLWAMLCLVLLAAGLTLKTESQAAAPPSSAMVLVLDISSSMTADDFAPQDRLAAARQALAGFIAARPESEMGLIQFAAAPRLLCPVTRDRRALAGALERIQAAEPGEDGTAIGSALAAALNRLREGIWQRRTILLVTDGVNNRGPLAPLDAARMAAALGVRIFAIGIGTDAPSRFWVPGPRGESERLEARIEIDDGALEALARQTGGDYRRVRNSDELRRALAELSIGTHAPVTKKVLRQDDRLPRMLAAAAFVCLLLEFIVAYFIFSELPG